MFAHHQEDVTVFTASGNVHRCCCRLASWMRWNCSSISSMTPASSSQVNIILNDDHQDAIILTYLFIPNQLYMFRAVFVHHQEHLTLFTASYIVHRYCCWLVSWMRWNCSTISSMTPASCNIVDNIRSCKYSQVLLMMGEDIARNM